MFRRVPVPGRLGKLECSWMCAVMIGYRSISGEYMVANAEGIFKTRTIRRVPLEKRWNKELVEAVAVTPWRVREISNHVDSRADQQPYEPGVEIQVDKNIEVEMKLNGASSPPSVHHEDGYRHVRRYRGLHWMCNCCTRGNWSCPQRGVQETHGDGDEEGSRRGEATA